MKKIEIRRGKINLAQVPLSAGVYLFINKKGDILYVGKAKSLRPRLSSYFRAPATNKSLILRQKAKAIKIIPTPSDFEALLLEARLIKKYQPPYNTQLKDDKHYLYIKITQDPVPLIATSRKKEEEKASFFGPYPSSGTVRFLLTTLRKIFPYRSCPHLPKKPCLYADLKLCPAPCSQEPRAIKENKKNINQISRILQGKSKQIIHFYQKKMHQEIEGEQFEKAALYKKIIDQLNWLTEKRIDPLFFEDKLLHHLSPWQKLKATCQLLKKYLPLPPLTKNYRIEGYDIAHLSGQEATGSMVVFIDGLARSQEYRQFKIRLKEQINDPAMLAHVIKRRFQHPEWQYPQLILIDGGKPQVGKVTDVLEKKQINIPVIGLAKRQETIIIRKENKFQEIKVPINSPSLLLLREARNEAHRFAQRYHHQRRQKKLKEKNEKNN